MNASESSSAAHAVTAAPEVVEQCEWSARVWRVWADTLAAVRDQMPLDQLETDHLLAGYALLSAGRDAVNQLAEVIAVADGLSQMYRRHAERVRPAPASGSESR